MDHIQPRGRSLLQHYMTTERAIQILLSCPSDKERLARTLPVSKRLKISQDLVFKIVSRLARAELVICLRGPQGGFQLARPANEITVGDVVRAFDFSPTVPDEFNGNAVFSKAFAAFNACLERYTLADFASRATPEASGKRRKRRQAGKK